MRNPAILSILVLLTICLACGSPTSDRLLPDCTEETTAFFLLGMLDE